MRNIGRNEFYELRHRPTFNVMPLPKLAAFGPAYGALAITLADVVLTPRTLWEG